MNNLVSIVVPIYNVEPYIHRCVDSLLDQTYKNLEIILVDDGSPDKCPQICDEYAAKDSRIKVIHKLNGGLSEARNVGMDNASGEYILFMDSDDFLEKDFFEVISPYIGKYDAINWQCKKIYGDKTINCAIYDELTFLDRTECEDFYRRIVGLYDHFLAHPESLDAQNPVWLHLYKSEIIKKNDIKFFSLKMIGPSEDLLFNIDYFSHVYSAICLPYCGYCYRKDNESSITSSYRPDLIAQWTFLYSLIERKLPDDEKIKQSFENRKALSVLFVLMNESGRKCSLVSKCDRYKEVINKEIFRNALNSLDCSLMPFHWKLFFLATKKQWILVLCGLLGCIKIIRKR